MRQANSDDLHLTASVAPASLQSLACKKGIFTQRQSLTEGVRGGAYGHRVLDT